MVGSKKRGIRHDDFKSFDARAEQGLAVACAIDNKTPIPFSVTIRAHKFADFLETLTPKRCELLRLSKAGNRSITELAVAAHRDPSAVSKDIAKLVNLGLVSVVVEINSGHGVKKIVLPAAENIEIHAAVL
jgi:predicted transcriptional regulator